MTAAWPADLPQTIEMSDFQESPPNLTLRTSMDAGPAKVRRRFTAGVRPSSASTLMTADQVATFDTFFMDTLEGGALPFTMNHQRTGLPATWRFDTSKQQPTYKPAGGDMWRVSWTWEQLP